MGKTPTKRVKGEWAKIGSTFLFLKVSGRGMEKEQILSLYCRETNLQKDKHKKNLVAKFHLCSRMAFVTS